VLASKISKNKFMNNLSSDENSFYLQNFYRASDIDVWFLSDNKQVGAELLTKNYWSKSNSEQFSIQQNIYLKAAHSSNIENMISDTIVDQESFFKISEYAPSLDFLLKRSDYANTFVFKHNCISKKRENKFSTIQFMRNKTDSVESLLGEFDIDICKVAYFNGKMYCDESFISSFQNKIVNVSEFAKNARFSLLNLLTTSQRLMKYIYKLNASLEHSYFTEQISSLDKPINHLGNQSFRLSTDSINFILNALFEFTNNDEYAEIFKNLNAEASIYSGLHNQVSVYPKEASNMSIVEYKKLEMGSGISLVNKLPQFMLTNVSQIDKKDLLKFSWIKYNRLQDAISSCLDWRKNDTEAK